MSTWRVGRAGWALVIAAIGCGGAGPRTIVEPRGVPGSSGAPSVSKVIDMGDFGAMPAIGQQLPRPDSDGVYAVGELVLIEGDDFGRLPTVNIGGQPAGVLARTGSGAILTRIPAGVPTGKIDVEVSHPGGRGSRSIEVRRYAVVAAPGGEVHVVQVAADGALTAAAKLAVPGARDVAISSDGSAAYVAADAAGGERTAGLAVISLVAGGGPKLVKTLRLAGTRAGRVVTADAAPLGVVVAGDRLVPFDTTAPRLPGVYDEIALPRGGVVAAALHPEGRTLALLYPDNQLVLVEVSRPDAARVGPAIDLLPGERMALGIDVAWSPAGDETWVLTGDRRESLAVGTHPAAILRVTGTPPAVAGYAEIAGLDAPLALAVARRESIQSGTAIRSTARRAAMVVAALDRGLVAGDAAALAQPHPFGQLTRTDLDGKGQPIWSGEGVIGDVELSQDVRFVLAADARAVRAGDAVTWELGVDLLPLAGGEPRRVVLGAVGDADRGAAAIAVSP